jgi:hypothetical protein
VKEKSGLPAGALGRLALLERDEILSNRHLAPAFSLSMILSENRFPLFGIML